MRTQCPVIVGRGDAIDTLEALLTRAASGSGGIALIMGEAGIGKSRLAAHMAHLAESRGMAVLRGRSTATEVPSAYRPLSEAFAAAVRGKGPPEASDIDPFRPALSRLVPEWTVRLWDGRETGAIPLSQVCMAEASIRLLREMGGDAGLVLVLEDLQWADNESWQIVEYLAGHLHTEPALLICTMRDLPTGPPGMTAESLLSNASVSTLLLQRLDQAGIESMIRACLDETPPAELVRVIHRYSDGLPLLVEELLAELIRSGGLVHGPGHRWTVDVTRLSFRVPPTLAVTVRRRLADLPVTARTLLGAAAVMGPEFDWRLAGEALDATPAEVTGGFELAIRAQLVETSATGGELRFRHSLTRDAVLAEMPPPERAALARRLLEAMERRGLQLDGATAVLAAELAELTGEYARSAELYRQVGHRAMADGALTSAITAFEHCRLVAPTPEQQWAADEDLVEALARAGRVDRVFTIGEPLVRQLSNGSPDQRVRLRLRLADAAVTATDWTLARAHIDAARADLADEPGGHSAVMALTAAVQLGEHNRTGAQRSALRALRLARQARDVKRVATALLLIGRCQRFWDFDAAERSFQEALAEATAAGLATERLLALNELAVLDSIRLADDERLVRTRQEAERAGALSIAVSAELHMAVRAWQRFELDSALEAAAQAARHAARYRLGLMEPAALIVKAACYAFHARRADIEDVLQNAQLRLAGDPELQGNLWAHVHGTTALADDDLQAAARAFDRARSLSTDPTSHLHGTWVLLHTLLGGSFGDLVAEVGLEASMQPIGRASVLAAQAVHEGRSGDAAAASGRYAEADAILATMPWHQAVVRRHVAYQALDSGWAFEPAWVTEAAQFFAGEGLSRNADACRAWLRKVGRPLPRRSAPDSRTPAGLAGFGLTSRELDVVLLVADGLTNQQIGQRLHLSTRTVEKHVERLLGKTSAANRTELAALTARSAG